MRGKCDMPERLWKHLRKSKLYRCAYCHQAVSIRRYENGNYYCNACGDRVQRLLHIRPFAESASDSATGG